MRLAALINQNAGSVKAAGVAALEQKLRSSLGDQLVHLHSGDGDGIKDACRNIAALHPDALMVLGGDGTARCAAEESRNSKMPLLFMPGGTMNVLPKKLGAPNSIMDAIDAVAAGQLQPIMLDVARANGQTFFVAAAFGVIPFMARWREEFRQQTPSMRLGWTMRQIRAFADRLFSPTVRLVLDNRQPLFPSPAVLIAVGDADTLAPGREAEPLNGLEVVMVHARDWLTLGNVIVNALVSAEWRNHKAVDTFRGMRVEVQAKRRFIRLTLDGEYTLLKSPVLIEYEKDALPVYSFIRAPIAADLKTV